jgi:hypothetical protein
MYWYRLQIKLGYKKNVPLWHSVYLVKHKDNFTIFTF